MKEKVDGLLNTYKQARAGSEERAKHLEHTYGVSEKFWDDIGSLMTSLTDLKDTLDQQEPPALEPVAIREQQDALDVSFYAVCSNRRMFSSQRKSCVRT